MEWGKLLEFLTILVSPKQSSNGSFAMAGGLEVT